jgi:HEAT repeat protein
MDLDEFRRGLASPDPHQRRLAIHAAEQSHDLRVMHRVVQVARGDDDEGVRSVAVRCLRVLGARLREASRALSTVPGLEPPAPSAPPPRRDQPSLSDPDAARRQRAVKALVAAGDKGRVEELVAALVKESDGWVRSEMAWGLGHMSLAEGVQPALESLLDDAVSRARANAVEALHKLGARGFQQKVLPLLKDSDRRVRSNAALAVAEGHWMDAEPVLVALARSYDRLDRQAAIYVASQLPPHRRGDIVKLLRDDVDDRIRTRARELEKP